MPYRVRIRKFLNIQGHSGNGFICAQVEDSTSHEEDKHGWPWVDIELTLADCSRIVRFDFPLSTPADRRNSLRKIRILVDTLTEFEAAFEAEARIAETRDRKRRGSRSDDSLFEGTV